MIRTLGLTILAGTIAFALDLCLAAFAQKITHVPPAFPPFTWLPVLSGSFGGAVLASLVYSLLRAFAGRPERIFFFIVATTLALSFSLPIRLSFTRSARFAGVTTSAQAMLLLMHTVVATVCVVTLLASTPRH